MSHVLSHERCPRCAKKGADRHGDNLAVYDDGHKYCYACHYYGHPPQTLARLKARTKAKEYPSTAFPHGYTNDVILEHLDTHLPSCAITWLRRYGITSEESTRHHFVWDDKDSSLVMPVLDGERVAFYSARYFGTEVDHPKYITKGNKNYVKLVVPQGRKSNIFVLVEDYLSAIKVGREVNAIPLFGTHASRDLLFTLLPHDPILRFWLDFDKAAEAAKQAARARQWFKDCATIVTELDPKEYPDEQIKSIINESILQPIESLLEQGPVPQV